MVGSGNEKGDWYWVGLAVRVGVGVVVGVVVWLKGEFKVEGDGDGDGADIVARLRLEQSAVRQPNRSSARK